MGLNRPLDHTRCAVHPHGMLYEVKLGIAIASGGVSRSGRPSHGYSLKPYTRRNARCSFVTELVCPGKFAEIRINRKRAWHQDLQRRVIISRGTPPGRDLSTAAHHHDCRRGHSKRGRYREGGGRPGSQRPQQSCVQRRDLTLRTFPMLTRSEQPPPARRCLPRNSHLRTETLAPTFSYLSTNAASTTTI